MDIKSKYIFPYVKIPIKKSITSSDYGKSKVITKLKKAIMNKDVDTALFWMIELHISEYLFCIWKVVLEISFKHIYTNPIFIQYILREFTYYQNNFRNIEYSYNNQEVRNHFVEVITAITIIDKQKKIKLSKIEPDNFEKENLKSLIEADKIYVHFFSTDKKCLRMPINELVYNIYKNDNTYETREKALFWLSFCFFLEKKYKKKKRDFSCFSRGNEYIDQKYNTDYSLIIWNKILSHQKLKSNKILKSNLRKLFKIFCESFTPSRKLSKNNLLVYAIYQILDTPNLNYSEYCPFFNYKEILKYQINTNRIYQYSIFQYSKYILQQSNN